MWCKVGKDRVEMFPTLPEIQSKMKVCRITLEFNSEFLNFLKATLSLSEFHEYKGHLTPAQQVALLVFGEGAGELSNHLEKRIHSDWKGMIRVVPEERRIYKEGKLIAGGRAE